MSILNDLVTYLAANGGGTVGTDLFESRLPDGTGTTDAAAALAEYQGVAPSYVHNSTAPAYGHPRVQLTVRDATYSLARSRAETINSVLAAITNQVLSGRRYLAVTPMSDPFMMMRDALDRPIIACNYEVMKDVG